MPVNTNNILILFFTDKKARRAKSSFNMGAKTYNWHKGHLFIEAQELKSDELFETYVQTMLNIYLGKVG